MAARKVVETAPLDPPPGTEDVETDTVDVPEPRQPRREQVGALTLTADTARQLTAAEARLARFQRHVSYVNARKYCAGDQVQAVGCLGDTEVRVLPYGIVLFLGTVGWNED